MSLQSSRKALLCRAVIAWKPVLGMTFSAQADTIGPDRGVDAAAESVKVRVTALLSDVFTLWD